MSSICYLIRDPTIHGERNLLEIEMGGGSDVGEHLKDTSRIEPSYTDIFMRLAEAGSPDHCPVNFLNPETAFEYIQNRYPEQAEVFEVVLAEQDENGITFSVVPRPEE